MGTSNFCKTQASDYFVVNGYDTEYKCSECGEYHYEKTSTCCDGALMEEEARQWETFQWEECKDHAKDYISDEILKLNPQNYVSNRTPTGDNDRNYYASGIIVVGRSFEYNNEKFDRKFEVDVEINIMLRSAYYQGANWDWDYKIHFSHYDTDGVEFVREIVKEDLPYYYGASDSLAEKYSILAEKKCQKTLDLLSADVEILLANLSTDILGVSARFSNGETWYSKVA